MHGPAHFQSPCDTQSCCHTCVSGACSLLSLPRPDPLGKGNSASQNGHRAIWSSWVPQITGAILYSLWISNHINQWDPWDKFFLKAHIWWCHFLREDHCAPICSGRKEKLLTAEFWTLLSFCCHGWVKRTNLSLLLFAWKEQRCGQKTLLVEYLFTPEVKQHSTSCLDSWKSKKGQRLETPTGSQPVPFLNLFFHLQPVNSKHTDKYYGRQHNSTAVFLQRAESFSPFLLCCLWKQGQ